MSTDNERFRGVISRDGNGRAVTLLCPHLPDERMTVPNGTLEGVGAALDPGELSGRLAEKLCGQP